MAQPEQSVQEIYVQPGESYLVSGPAVLRTVLGSCVGITFLVPRLGIGGLCHPMLPRSPNAARADMKVCAGRRYVDFAIRDMAQQLDSFGAHRREIDVKLFGGGDVLPIGDCNLRPTVGRLNCEAALRVLEEEGFSVAATRLGGNTGVHIQFQTETGEVLLRQLDSSMAQGKTQIPRTVDRLGQLR